MAHTPDGGPAHGGTRTEQITHIDGSQTWADVTYYGLTIRDYFAAKAMPQVIAHIMTVRATMIKPGQFNFDEVGDTAYQMADAMLRARAAQSPREAQDAHIQEFGK